MIGVGTDGERQVGVAQCAASYHPALASGETRAGAFPMPGSLKWWRSLSGIVTAAPASLIDWVAPPRLMVAVESERSGNLRGPLQATGTEPALSAAGSRERP